ncbi:hypothetical protein GCM10010464_81010 [Pseudonocardia yunnanensis]|uniref:Uncharacterized protein n=1 Tax=Pseudonocardia yunnanensis TaxID=58107 RepID=A0ABW4ESX2_9PSEU
MAVYRTQDRKNDHSENGNTKVSQRGKANRSKDRSNNRTTTINILGVGSH